MTPQERSEFVDSSVVGAVQTFVFKHPLNKDTTIDKTSQDQSDNLLKAPPSKRMKLKIMSYLGSSQHSYSSQNNSINLELTKKLF